MTTSNSKRPPRPLVVLFGLPQHLYRHRWGWVLGHRFLQLTHTGRSSGRTYQTILEVVQYDPESQEATVGVRAGCGLAAQRASQWSSRGQHRTVFVHGHPTVWSGSRRRWRSSRPTNDGTVSSARLCA